MRCRSGAPPDSVLRSTASRSRRFGGAVRSTQLLMRHTSTNYLEVLTAQQRLLEAVVSLYHALGGGAK